MPLAAALATALLLLHSVIASSSNDTFYLFTVNSQPVGGSTETLCAHLYASQTPLTLQVNLEYGKTNKTLLSQNVLTSGYNWCVPFQVPAVTMDTIASIYFEAKGKTVFVNKTKILIRPPALLTLIETDKPIYKPGQTVKFRVVSLDSRFLTHNQMFPTVELQDPNSNRIGQWLNTSTSNGLLDLSYPMSSEAPLGSYVITAWNERNEPVVQRFEIEEYVLPKFEVTVDLPSVITILDSKVALKVCAKYTYGKPVIGSTTAVVCQRSYKFWWLAPGPTQPPDICKTYSTKTDRMGCGSYIIDLRNFALNDTRYEETISVDAELEEFGTGVVLSGSGSAVVASDLVILTFVDTPDTFKLGFACKGKIEATGPDSAPVKNQTVYLNIKYGGNESKTLTLLTDDAGIAQFSLDTRSWGSQPATLEAQYHENVPPGNLTNVRTPNYLFAELLVQPFYSPSRSFLALQRPLEALRCNGNAAVHAQYIIPGSVLKPSQLSLNFFYMVMTQGRMIQHGNVSVSLQPGKENLGEVVVSLQGVRALAPVAQVLVYAMLPGGEVVADSMDFPVELCLANEVSVNFTSPIALPGSPVELAVKAYPGSLCSVRAIDQSLLLLRPEEQLSMKSVFERLQVYKLTGYPDGTEDSYSCSETPTHLAMLHLNPRFGFFDPYNGNLDVYAMFKAAGIKVLTNTDIRKPVECLFFADMAFGESAGSGQNEPTTTVRSYFPETWIWDLVSVGTSGVVGVSKTVPDTITTWQAGAFCTSPVGFGVAPSVNLTAFQPFFVSLTLPYSIVHGEVFTLRATVFNYLPSCIAVQAILASSQQFSIQPCVGCSYTRCVCADESWTFLWVIQPSVLGEVVLRVTAQAVQTYALCGGRASSVPEKGRVDIVEQTLLVVAEGTKETNAYNELLCPTGGAVETNVTLTLPKVFVAGSPTASVSVLGDLMGRALQNLDSLLSMPFGCGEQNMLLFAPDIFILEYLESSGQLTPAITSKATSFLLSGYQRELTYKHEDGSYSAFGTSDESGNTWLTAFVLKSFESAKQYIFIDQAVIDEAQTWLVNRQQKNGCFASVGNLIHVDMQGGVNDEVTLSAYITAALLELGIQKTDPTVSKSLDCLRNAYPRVNSTYTLALLSYTFTLAGDLVMRNVLLSRLDRLAVVTVDGRHWIGGSAVTGTGSLEVETTSYVLLAVLSGPPVAQFNQGYSASIVRWLGQQQNAFGGFSSTQDTVVALQALAKYCTATYRPLGAIAVNITSPSGLRKSFTVNQSNRLLYQYAQLQEVTGVYKVSAAGQGCVFVQFSMHYNIPPPKDFSSFSILVNTTANCSTPNPSLGVAVTIRYNGKRTETNMVVIDIKLLSGFKVVEGSLNPEVSNGTVKRVDQTEENVIVYLDGLKKGEPHTYTLFIQRDVAVQNLKPAVVKVYDYYQTSKNQSLDFRNRSGSVTLGMGAILGVGVMRLLPNTPPHVPKRGPTPPTNGV